MMSSKFVHYFFDFFVLGGGAAIKLWLCHSLVLSVFMAAEKNQNKFLSWLNKK
jgi:hypothetical protein